MKLACWVARSHTLGVRLSNPVAALASLPCTACTSAEALDTSAFQDISCQLCGAVCLKTVRV